MRGGHAERGGAIEGMPGRRDADGGVRIHDVAVPLVHIADGPGGDSVVDRHGGDALVRHAIAEGCLTRGGEVGHEGPHASGVVTEPDVQEALEVAGYLNVHRRTQRVADRTAAVNARLKEPRQDVVLVRREDESVDRYAHLADGQPREDVPEVARRHHEGRWLGGLEGRVDVVGHLREDARPVHGVDGAKLVAGLEGEVAEDRLQDALAVVEATVDREAVDVGVRYRRHLQFLQPGGLAVGVEHEDADVRATAHAVDRCAPGVAAGRAHDVQVPPGAPEDVLEEPSENLQRHVLERQRGAVEELQQFEVAEIDDRHDVGVVEGGEGVGDETVEVVARHVVDVETEDLLREFHVRQPPPRVEPVVDIGEPLRYQQPAVWSEPREHGRGERHRWRLAAGRNVAHVRRRRRAGESGARTHSGPAPVSRGPPSRTRPRCARWAWASAPSCALPPRVPSSRTRSRPA